VAVASGEGIWGIVGSPAALEHTALGPPVDAAVRLAEVLGEHGVVICEETLNSIPRPRFQVEPFEIPTADSAQIPRAYRITTRRSQ
jgi:class 3 adenylate cyclase